MAAAIPAWMDQTFDPAECLLGSDVLLQTAPGALLLINETSSESWTVGFRAKPAMGSFKGKMLGTQLAILNVQSTCPLQLWALKLGVSNSFG